MLEQEIKLVYGTPEAARRSIQSAGGRLVVSRRLLDDRLYDTADQTLRRRGEAMRVRRDDGRGILTFKGAAVPSAVKTREEIEVGVADAAVIEAILTALGYRCWFRAQKYREEYDLEACRLMIDETPIGVFVEIEGDPDAIARTAGALGRSPADYSLESYPRLYQAWCEARGVPFGDMMLDGD